MASSSNRHWPSLYRSSLACNLQQQPDMNNKSSSLMSSRCEENGGRNPEARPRWNPRPEQIRILEAIFNSGMVNPPRDEIRRIRLQLQEHGPVGDANVFYWFQNRKSRTKHKLRAAAAAAAAAGHPQPPSAARAALLARACAPPPPPPVTPPRHHLPHLGVGAAAVPVAAAAAPTSSSSSSSERSSGSSCSKSVTPTTAAGAIASCPAAAAAASVVFRQGGSAMPATAMDLLTPLPTSAAALAARQLYYQYQYQYQYQYHHSQIMAPAAPAPMPGDLMITSQAEPPPPSFLPQWQQQQGGGHGGQHYLPATELGGVLGGHTDEQHRAAVFSSSLTPSSVLFGLCNEALLGQDDCADDGNISIVDSKQGLGGHGQQFWNSSPTCGGSDDLISNGKTDAVSAVIRDDEKARLGLLHCYGHGLTATTPASAPPPPAAAAAGTAAMVLPSSAPSNATAATNAAVLTDQLQGLLDAGLLIGDETPPPPPPATATVVAVARDAVTCAATATAQFSVPAAMRLDVKLAFGEAAVLARHTGEAVPVDESGVTVEPLQQDTLYYVLMATI